MYIIIKRFLIYSFSYYLFYKIYIYIKTKITTALIVSLRNFHNIQKL